MTEKTYRLLVVCTQHDTVCDFSIAPFAVCPTPLKLLCTKLRGSTSLETGVGLGVLISLLMLYIHLHNTGPWELSRFVFIPNCLFPLILSNWLNRTNTYSDLIPTLKLVTITCQRVHQFFHFQLYFASKWNSRQLKKKKIFKRWYLIFSRRGMKIQHSYSDLVPTLKLIMATCQRSHQLF